MRIVAAHPGPAFSVHDVFVGWVEALKQLGCKVAEYNLSDRLTFYDSAMVEVAGKPHKALTPDQAKELAVNGLYSTLYKLQPDVLFLVSAFFYPLELLDMARARGTRVVVLHTESPYEDARQQVVAQYADVNLVNDPTNLAMFPRGTRYAPHAFRPELHRPGPPTPELLCDLAFVGTGYGSRIKFLEAMDLSGLDVVLAGNWQQVTEDSPLRLFIAHDKDECLDNEQTVQVYRSANVGLNLYRREAESAALSHGWAVGPREVEMAATGLFFLRDKRGEGDELFPMLPSFTDAAEASELLRHWLDRDDRLDVALKAREAVADRTFVNNAAALLSQLSK